MKRQGPVLLVLAVFAVALAARTGPLYWSPLPSTLDGFGYAALARDTVALARFPVAEMRADNFVYAGLLAVAGLVLDRQPLTLAQPLTAVVGAAACLAGVAITHRFARSLEWPRRRVDYAAAFAGVALATSGIFMRRTSETDEEALAFLLVPLLAVALHRYLATERRAWGLVAAALLVAFPLVHTFSTLIAALTLTAVLAIHLARAPAFRTGAVGTALVGGFWAYFAAYYEFAERTALSVPYVGRVTAHPGLFVAWGIVLVVGVVRFRSAGPRLQRAAVLAPFAVMFAVLVANAVAPVFPGTVTTPGVVTALALLYVLPVLAASRAAPLLGGDGTRGTVVLALLAAPVAHVGFSLTADLTPEFFGTVMRTQTFAHLPVFVLAGLAVGRTLSPPRDLPTPTLGRKARLALVGVLLASVLLTAPLAFLTLDTAAIPSTTTEEEFAGASFATAHVEGPWASDHKRSRIAVHYYGSDVSVGPVGNWLRGGSPPTCPVLSAASWTTTGAHFFPAAPETIDRVAYDRFLRERNLVYATAGPRGMALTRPTGSTAGGC